MLPLRPLALVLLASVATAAERPNVILMMGDDHGWEETGYHGHPYVKTPVLDEMAASGLRMDRFYAAHPSCSPTRASYLTGRHPNRMGTFAPGWSFRPEEITVAHVMGKAGYHCAHFGKWHVGAVKAESPVSPGAMGFHEWLSHDNFFELNPSFSRNGVPPERFEGESSEILVREAMQSIARAKAAGKPFFQVIWFGSPHEPYSGLPQDLALYDHVVAKHQDKKVKLTSNETGGPTTRPQGEVLRERYAEITAMDRAIGQLRAHLKSEGLRENTLLFYCGDNGTSPDAAVHHPHRGQKADMYEGGILVPGIIEWPARIPQPRQSSVPATTSDLLPTLCGIVAQPLPGRPLDGIDLAPLLDAKMDTRLGALHFWGYDTNRFGKQKDGSVVKREPYLDPKLQEGTTPLAKKSGGKATRDFTNYRHSETTEADYRGARAIIDGNHKLVLHDSRGDKVREELFDLSSDPKEQHNLASEQPERLEQLKAKLREWQTGVLKSLGGADY